MTLSKATGFIILTVATLLATGCSMKRNTASTRHYQAFITQYNILYNGEEHYRSTAEALLEAHGDDYSALLPVDPLTARSNEAGGAFDRSVEKAMKAISLRSIKRRPRREPGRASRDHDYAEWLTREEFNPVIHQAWMLLGKSRLMNGEANEAAATFLHIINHFDWLAPTVAEAKVWRAKSLAASGDYSDAERVLKQVDPTTLPDKSARYEYYLTLGDILKSTERYYEAVAPIQLAAKIAPRSQRHRLAYLAAQLCALSGHREEAYDRFSRVARSATAPATLRLNARIRRSEVFTGSDITKEAGSLQTMVKFGRNADIADKIHYATGNLYLAHGDTARAIAAYRLAIDSRTNSTETALASLKLGEIAFARRDYHDAQPYYSQAVAGLPETHPAIEDIKYRSDILDELSIYRRNTDTGDSLLRLSYLSPDKQKEIALHLAREYTAHLENLQRDSALQAATTMPTGSIGQLPATFSINNDRSWYFYNKALVEAGRLEFQRRWGRRKLEDDWRRRNKSTFSFSEFESGDDEAENQRNDDGSALTDRSSTENADNPATPEYYLKNIPATETQRDATRAIIMEGLFNMGLILKDRLEDRPRAAAAFRRLLTEYPDNVYRADTYHNLFLISLRDNDDNEAARLAAEIKTEFPGSPLAQAVSSPDYLSDLRNMAEHQEELYACAYALFMDGASADSIHAIAAEAQRRFPISDLLPKFMFLDALAFATEGDNQNFTSTIHVLLSRYPEADVAAPASEWLRGQAQGRRVEKGVWRPAVAEITTQSVDASVPTPQDSETTATTADSTATPPLSDGPRMLVLTFPTDTINANRLLYEIARFNFSTFTIRDFELEQHTEPDKATIIIRGFVSRRDVDSYLLRLPAALLPLEVKIAVEPDPAAR